MLAVVEFIGFPDAESVVVAFLKAQLTARSDEAKVGTKVPAVRPARLVRVSRTGGILRNLVTDSPQLTFECWDANEVAASDLCKLVRAIIHAAPQLTLTGAVCNRVQEVGGPVSFPDPDTSNPRYQFTAALDLQGAVL